MIRDKHVDVMLFWAILFVVMGHNYQMNWFFFPAYAFHIPLFFFISGYLFSIKETIKEKISFIFKKVKRQLLPYFFINLAFGILTFFLAIKGIKVGDSLSFKSLFITPIINGHQYDLSVSLWFLLNLFFVNIIAQLINWKNTRKAKIIVFLIVLPISLYCAYKGLENYKDFRLPIIRTGIALLFFEIGILMKEFRKGALNILKNPSTIGIMWILVAVLRNFFGKIDYALIWGSVQNNFFIVPLITSFLIICISYSICYYLSKVINDNSWIIKVGQKTFYIMALHMLIFFIINFILYKLNIISSKQLNAYSFSYDPAKWFLVYQIPAIVLPVLIGFGYDKIKVFVFGLIDKIKERHFSLS